METVISLLKQIKDFENNAEKKEGGKLPSKCYFLDKDKVLCYPRNNGDSRFPYACNGRVMWAYSSGMVSIEESTFNIFLPAYYGMEPNFSIYGGVRKAGEEKFMPFPLVSVQNDEDCVKRFMVFDACAAYYFTFIEQLTFATKLFMGVDGKVYISVYVINEGAEAKEIMLSSYFDLFIRHGNAESFESKWYRSCDVSNGYALTETLEYFGGSNRLTHYGLIRNQIFGGEKVRTERTASRNNYVGGYGKGVRNADCYYTGKFSEKQEICAFSEKSVCGDVSTLTVGASSSVSSVYILTLSEDYDSVLRESKQSIKSDTLSAAFNKVKEVYQRDNIANKIDFEFGNIEGGLKANSYNWFVYNVIKQVDFCAKAKNYAGEFLGVRDIFQQVEAALMWNPEYCRGKIIECIGFIGEDGRAPRQFSYPGFDGDIPAMDLRKFIDQGLWIISTVYAYLAFSGDFSILDEKCGYYRFDEYTVKRSKRFDSVLEHILQIADYLCSNIDAKTGCLHALYGDWNDALDGLGRTEKEGVEFGNGVSVMASLQLYKALVEIVEILQKQKVGENKIREYQSFIDNLKVGLQKFAVCYGENGNRKIIHGWGDERSYLVGSFSDNDGASRDSATSNAFWVLCGGYDWDKTIKEDIVAAYKRLDSKYGIKTFQPGFERDNHKVGRISVLPIGTAENGATYIHASLFAIWSLFKMGEDKLAWEQLLKVLPITHEHISTTPFIMSNSYLYSKTLHLDGESMNDWFTGSGCVLAKVLVRSVFGVEPNLDAIIVKPSKYFPTHKAQLKMTVKGKQIAVKYENKGLGERKFFVNGIEVFPDKQGAITLQKEKLSLAENIVSIVE